MKKGIFMLLCRVALSLVLGLFFCCANAINFGPFSISSTSIDSGQVRPPGGFDSSTAVSVQYPGTSIPSTPGIINENYDSLLKPCPVPSIWGWINCPDINGNLKPGTTLNCPTTCTVTRLVELTDPSNPNSQIKATFPAVCPPGFTSIGVYKMDREIVTAASDLPAPYPIADMAAYNSYIASGYNCNTFVAAGAAVNQCGFLNDAVFSNTAIGVVQGYVGVYYNYSHTPGTPIQRYTISSNCGLPASPLDQYYYVIYSVYWKWVSCYLPKGSLAYTNNMVPTSVVCTMAKPVWQPAN